MKSRTIVLTLASVVSTVAVGGAIWFGIATRAPGEDTVARLIGRLRDGPAPIRREAATALGQLIGPGSLEAAQALMESLADPDPELRARAARSLGALLCLNQRLAGSVFHATAEALTKCLSDRDARVRATSALALGSLGLDPPGVLGALVDGLGDGDPSLRAEAEAAIKARPSRDADSVRRLLGLVDDPHDGVRDLARSALLRAGPAHAPEVIVPPLATVLRTGSPSARELAALMLGRSVSRSNAARDLLQATLRGDTSPAVRVASASSLGAYADDAPARAALCAATDDPDLQVRATASVSLGAGQRASRAEALAELKSALAADVEPSSSVAILAIDPRTTRAQALAALKTKALLGGNRGSSTLFAEVEADSDRAVPRLILALRDPRPRVRAATARVLGEIASKSTPPCAVDGLTLALSDPDASVRRASASALARFGPAAATATSALNQALHDPDPDVKAAALAALQGLDRSVQKR